jgi:transglutaminase-like putative cysteine protease/peroxiredoxin
MAPDHTGGGHGRSRMLRAAAARGICGLRMSTKEYISGRWTVVLLALIFTLLTVSCTSIGTDYTRKAHFPDQSLDIPKTIPAKYLESVRLSLDEAGDNAPELIKVLITLRGRELEWACFLIGTMPFSDLISIKADYLLEHIHYTSLAKDKYKWMRQIPEDVFVAYVLPYRISSEPLVSHRRYLFEQLDPLVRNCADIFEVSYQVNLWLGGERKGARARVHFEPGEARNKSPFGTLLSGQGRCGELTITLVAALRAAGVPARSVYTPSWVKSDNNHAWTEIWAEGKWYAMASGHPSIQSALAATAGKAWFTEPAATAAAIYSERFGTPEDKSSVYKASKRDSLVNVLSNYSQTSKLDITVLTPDGKAASDAPVALSVVNGGVFRKVALQKTDAEGKATITAGIGQYMLSAGNGDLVAWQIIATTPAALPVTLTLAKDNSPLGYYVLTFPNTHDAYIAFNPAAAHSPADMEIPEKYKIISPEHSPEAPPEKYCYEKFKIEEHPGINALIGQSPLSGSIVGAMELAGGNWPEIAAAVTDVPEEEKEDLLWLISTMNQVDAVETTREILLEHVHYAQLARKGLPIQISDDIYQSYVLSPRIPYMHVYQWRKELYDRFIPAITKGTKPQNIADMALRINKWIEENITPIEVSSRRFMATTNPAAVFKSRRAPSSGPILATVAALRSAGIPARVKSTWVEFYDGSKWAPLYPMDSKSLCNTEAAEANKREYAKKGGVRAITTKNGFVFSTGGSNWGIARFDDGGWDYLKDESGNGWTGATPGKYLFTASARNTSGDVLIYTRPITVESNKGMEITVPLDLPVEMLSTAERLVRKLGSLPDFTLRDRRGKSYNLRQILSTSNVLLIFFTLESEPSIRMLPLIQSISDKAKSSDVTILAILTDKEEKANERLIDITFPILLDKDMSVAKQFIPDIDSKKSNIMPSILLINKNDEIILWKEGYNLAINDILVDAFNTLSRKEAVATTLDSLQNRVEIKEVDLIGLDYAQKGFDYLSAGDYPKAVQYYKMATDAFPDISELWYNYSCALSRNNDINEAFAALRKAIELGNNDFTWIKQDPDLENLRKDKRFPEIVRIQNR